MHEEKDDALGGAGERGSFAFAGNFPGKHRLKRESAESGSRSQ